MAQTKKRTIFLFQIKIFGNGIEKHFRPGQDIPGFFPGQQTEFLVIAVLAQIERPMQIVTHFLGKSSRFHVFPVKNCDNSGVFGCSHPLTGVQGQKRIEHGVIGAVDDAAQASLGFQQDLRVLEGLFRLEQAVFDQGVEYFFQRRSPVFFIF